MKYLPLIWSGIWRKPGRAVLMFLQVTVAVALFGVLQGLKGGVDQAVAESRADLLVVRSREPFSDSLPIAWLKQIQAIPGVRLAFAQDGFDASYRLPTQRISVNVLPADATWAAIGPELSISKAAVSAFSHTRTGALVGETLVKKYGWKVGDRIPLNSGPAKADGSTDWVFDVVGTFRYVAPLSQDDFIAVQYEYYDAARRDGRGTVADFQVVVRDPRDAEEVADAIDRRFANSAHETRTESLREMAQSQMQQIGNLDFAIRSIVSAALVALVFSTTTMALLTIRQRTPELAVLKTIGFTDSSVFLLVCGEALAVWMLAAGSGLALAIVAFPWADRFVPGLAMPPAVIAVGLLGALFIGVLSASLAALRAARLEVANALADR